MGAATRALDEVLAPGASLPFLLLRQAEQRVVPGGAAARPRMCLLLAARARGRRARRAAQRCGGERGGPEEGRAVWVVAVHPVCGSELARLLLEVVDEGAAEEPLDVRELDSAFAALGREERFIRRGAFEHRL